MADDLPEPPRSRGELVVYQPPPVPDRGGRRTTYTIDIGLEICLRLSEGQTLLRICKDPEMPPYRTVMDWLHYAKRVTPQIAEFRKMHARARIAQMHAWSDEIIDIADDGTNDWYRDDDGRMLLNHEHVARSKIRIDTRLRLMGTVARHHYGTSKEAVMNNLAEGREPGAARPGDDARPVLSDHEKARRIAFLMYGKGGAKVQEAAKVEEPAAPEAAPPAVDDVDEDWFGDE